MGVRWKNLLYLDILCILDCTLCLKPLLCLLHLHVNSVRQILKKVLKSARGFISFITTRFVLGKNHYRRISKILGYYDRNASQTFIEVR